MWEVLRRWNSIEFSQESQENLARANELLKEHSVIMYITHTSLLPDAAWSIALAISQLTNIRRILGPVARKHEDFSNHPSTSILLQLARAMGVELFPVVTHASSDSDKQYTRKEQRAHQVADLHMMRLARLVAEKYRGPYGKKVG